MSERATTQFAGINGSLLLAMVFDPSEIGQRIKRAREKRGWTQFQLALEAHKSPGTISKWETGHPPSVRELIRLAGVLGVPAEELVEDQLPTQEGERLEEMLVRLERVVEALEKAAAPTG